MVSVESVCRLYSLKNELDKNRREQEQTTLEINNIQLEFESIVSNMHNMDKEECAIKLNKMLNVLKEKIEEVNKRDEFIEHAKQEIISLQSEFKEE